MLGFALTPAFVARQPREGGGGGAVNLVAHPTDASQWSYLVATYSGPLGLNAVNGYPGYALRSGGAYFHRAIFHEQAGQSGDEYAITYLVRPGSSGKMRIWAWMPDVGSENNRQRPVASLSGTSGPLSVIENSLMADGVTRKIVATYAQPADGAVKFAIGPASNVVGDDLVVIGVQVESGLVANEFTA